MTEDKPIDEKLRDIANSLLGRVQSTDEGEDEDEKDAENRSAEGKAPDTSDEGGEENAGDAATPSISSSELVDVLTKVNEHFDAREKQVNDLVETVRLLIQATPAAKNENADNSAKERAGKMPTSSDVFGELDLRRK